jgi:hypothetical protein
MEQDGQAQTVRSLIDTVRAVIVGVPSRGDQLEAPQAVCGHSQVQVIYRTAMHWIDDCKSQQSIAMSPHEPPEVRIGAPQGCGVGKAEGRREERGEKDGQIDTRIVERAQDVGRILAPRTMDVGINDHRKHRKALSSDCAALSPPTTGFK